MVYPGCPGKRAVKPMLFCCLLWWEITSGMHEMTSPLPQNCTFFWGYLRPRLIYGSLEPHEFISHTASRSIQPFCSADDHDQWTETHIHTHILTEHATSVATCRILCCVCKAAKKQQPKADNSHIAMNQVPKSACAKGYFGHFRSLQQHTDSYIWLAGYDSYSDQRKLHYNASNRD